MIDMIELTIFQSSHPRFSSFISFLICRGFVFHAASLVQDGGDAGAPGKWPQRGLLNWTLQDIAVAVKPSLLGRSHPLHLVGTVHKLDPCSWMLLLLLLLKDEF